MLPSMPIVSCMEAALACDFSDRGRGPIVLEDREQAGDKQGDIVLLRGPDAPADDQPYSTWEAVDWLIDTGIKAPDNESFLHSLPWMPPGVDDQDARCLLADVAMLDTVTNLDWIDKTRVFFLGLPVKIQRVTACWV